MFILAWIRSLAERWGWASWVAGLKIVWQNLREQASPFPPEPWRRG